MVNGVSRPISAGRATKPGDHNGKQLLTISVETW